MRDYSGAVRGTIMRRAGWSSDQQSGMYSKGRLPTFHSKSGGAMTAVIKTGGRANMSPHFLVGTSSRDRIELGYLDTSVGASFRRCHIGVPIKCNGSQ